MKHVVGFSGGIDSQACALWVRNRYPKDDVILLNSDAGGNENPMTVEFIKTYSETVHPVVVVSAIIADLGNRGTRPGQAKNRRDEFKDSDPLTFDRLAYIKGRFPSSQAQFCTEHLKLAPAKRWMTANIAGDFMRYSGVRRQESRRRKDRQFMEWDDYFDCDLCNPLVDWSKQMCFDYVKHHGEAVNPLYSLGFERVGCAPCINSSKHDILQWVKRDPAMIDKVREYERYAGRTFFAPCVPGMAINWIDDVVDWAHTEHGGVQYSLRVLHTPSCESSFGLCE